MADLKQAIAQAIDDNAGRFVGAADAAAVSRVAKDVADQVEKNIPSATSDPWSFRAVIVILGSIVFLVTVVYGWHALTPMQNGKSVLESLPEALIALGSVSLGALAGILAPSPRAK